MPETQNSAVAFVDKPFVLTPPERLSEITAEQVHAVTVFAEAPSEASSEAAKLFVASLLEADVDSEAFRAEVEQAFSGTRARIAEATTLSSAFTRERMSALEDSPAYAVINQMRVLFEEHNPARQGDLFGPRKILGVPVPFGNKLQTYLRKYQSVDTQLGALSKELENAKTALRRELEELAVIREKLWASMGALEETARFLRDVDREAGAAIEALKGSDPRRARVLEQEVLYFAGQALSDVEATRAFTINAYNVFGELRKTGRETLNGCDRVATLGVAALSVAVTLAQATGLQMRTQQMLDKSRGAIEGLILATSDAFEQHATHTVQFASNPVLGVETLQKLHDATVGTVQKLDNYRTEAIGTNRRNAEMARAIIERQQEIAARNK